MYPKPNLCVDLLLTSKPRLGNPAIDKHNCSSALLRHPFQNEVRQLNNNPVFTGAQKPIDKVASVAFELFHAVAHRGFGCKFAREDNS